MPGELTRAALVQEARRQVNEGAHYIKRGFGQRRDINGNLTDGGVPGRERAVRMITDSPRGVGGIPSYVRYAAWSDLGGRRVCAGRCHKVGNEATLPVGDPDDPAHLAAPTQYVWRRPENRAENRIEVLGECCVGKRHFDCFGFVNYCYWCALGAHFPGDPAGMGPPGWRHPRCSSEVNRFAAPVQSGDILFLDTRHMGMAISPTQVAHAAGYYWGVQITPINGAIYPHDADLRFAFRWDAVAARPHILDTMP